eukprot:11173145-Lingulodinium_polyedra.AAC.1
MNLFQQRALIKYAKHANQWLDRRVSRYWQAIQDTCRVPGLNVFGLALDQTRAGQKDMLFTALYLPELHKGCWLPPQETRPRCGYCDRGGPPKAPAENRRKHRFRPPQTAENTPPKTAENMPNE